MDRFSGSGGRVEDLQGVIFSTRHFYAQGLRYSKKRRTIGAIGMAAHSAYGSLSYGAVAGLRS